MNETHLVVLQNERFDSQGKPKTCNFWLLRTANFPIVKNVSRKNFNERRSTLKNLSTRTLTQWIQPVALKESNLINKENRTNMQLLPLSAYQLCVAKNQTQQSTIPHRFTGKTSQLMLWCMKHTNCFWENRLVFWENQTISEFWLYRSIIFCNAWIFFHGLYKWRLFTDTNKLIEIMIEQIKNDVLKKTSLFIRKFLFNMQLLTNSAHPVSVLGNQAQNMLVE